MNIVVVESPAKAKTINKYLGPGYEVLASFGHIRDLPAKDGSVQPDKDFEMSWEVDSASAKRVNEIAVRSAFGAERGRLLKMFVTRALQLAAIGIVIGVAGAVAMRRIVASQLYETSALDPWVLALVPLTMVAVTLLASYVPARRASRIDVSAALREN